MYLWDYLFSSSSALRTILRRGGASTFWNAGKKPDPRLNIQRDLEAWIEVNGEMNKGVSRSEAIVIAAKKLGFINDNSADAEEDHAIRKVTNQYESCQRKFKKFRRDRDHFLNRINPLAYLSDVPTNSARKK